MRFWWLRNCVVGVVALALGGAVVAQEGPGGDEPTPGPKLERGGEVITVAPQPEADHPNSDGLDGLPAGVVREQVSERIQERLRSFEELREAYLDEQRKLMQEMRGATTDTDRERVRERIRTARRDWIVEVRRIRELARGRVQSLRDALPNHRELLEKAKENVRDEVQQGIAEARERVRRGLE